MPGWRRTSLCCLCQKSSRPHNVVHNEIETDNSVCDDCKSRFKTEYYKASTGLLAYNTPEPAGLIVGVRTRLEPDLSRLVQGLPQGCFRANNLPDGLKLDASTGVIEGTPVGPVSRQATVTVFNSRGEIGTTVLLKIVAERAPSSLEYDVQSASTLIVDVEMKLAPQTGFVAGMPAAKFMAISDATLSALALEHRLRLASVTTRLAPAIQDVCNMCGEIQAADTALVAHTARLLQLQGAILQQPPLSSDLSSQSLETLEKELAHLRSAQKSAADSEQYDEAERCFGREPRNTAEDFL